MVNSMTGFATLTGQVNDLSWVLELKSVNARGLDLRMRLFDASEVLEPIFKKEISKIVKRGAVNVFLRTENRAAYGVPTLNKQVLASVLDAMQEIETQAKNIAPSTSADILRVRGVFEPAQADSTETDALAKEIKAQIPTLVTSFAKSRASEGAALEGVLELQIDLVAAFTKDAKAAAGDRKVMVAARLAENLKLIMSETDGLDSDRLEQELALLAVKADVTEEIDRLIAHVEAARQLLASDGPIGRKFDFLMQEFNREANTLCSKAGSTELTRIGLDLKTVIDQMREQVQNVE